MLGPSFIVIGAMKCGTHSLHRYLNSHKGLNSSIVKETNFFSSEGDFKKGIAWYHSLFRQPGKVGFEASPNYTKRHIFSGVPERMSKVLPNVKLIYVVRAPIERMLSHYIHSVYLGREKRTFDEIISIKNSNYVKTGLYYYQMEAFLDWFPKSQIMLLDSSKLLTQTESTLSELCDFLGVKPDFNSDVINQKYHSSDYKISRSILIPEKPTIKDEWLLKGEELFADDISRLEKTFSISFKDWGLN